MRAAFAGLVDYAGLFPPAACSMADAVSHYADYRRSADRWMLGRFVVSAAQLGALATTAAPLAPVSDPWLLAVTLGADHDADLTAVERFDVPGLQVDAIECKINSVSDVQAFEGRALATPCHYFEVGTDVDPDEIVNAIASSSAMGKVRTGGLTPEAFPRSRDIVRLLSAFIDADVPFKATAGLHHPFTGTYPISYASDAIQQPMFGFVNLLLAVAELLERDDAERAAVILEDAQRSSILVAPDGITWRGERFDVDTLERAHREAFTSFGSCSFREPYDELALAPE